MSSPAANDLNRLLLGSAIGAAIGLVLLALGVAILWNAADQRLSEPDAAAPAAGRIAPAPPAEAAAAPAATDEAMPYPALPPAPAVPAPVPVEPPRAVRPTLWGSIFDRDEGAAPAEARTSSVQTRAAPAPRPATPRRPPEAQRQDDSLFF